MIVAYIKLSDYCNVGCDHCYLPEKDRLDKRIISNEDLSNASKQIVEMAKMNATDKVMLMLHGGEPLALSPALVEDKMQIVKNTLKENGLFYQEGVQTSLINFDKTWVDIAKNNWDSHIGFSVDFSTRTIGGSNIKYLKLLEKRLETLRKHDIHYGAVFVPSVNELGRTKEIVDWFVKEGVDYITIDRYTSFGGYDPLRPKHGQHSEFLSDLTDSIIDEIKTNGAAPKFGAVTAAINGVHHGVPSDRWGTTCQEKFIVIGVDGKTNNCPDKFAHEKSYSDSDTFVLSEERMNSIFDYKINHKNLYCDSCEYSEWCKTGCPIVPNNPLEEGDCAGYKRYLTYLKTLMKDKETKRLLLEYAK
ncbi:hypothetical protein [Vibrio crassostreae]|uniref:hypothetical protein n=1 Tax=Vibrio crassostreae TaxID=246167 RepID=UPI001B302961|nr:hypothetical protein [Vibrio crassostreae]